MRPSPRSLLLLCAVLAGARLDAMDRVLEKLAKNSPFGAAPADAPGPAAADPEFRGYYAESGEQFFCIYDPASRRSFWLRCDETGEPFVARKFSESQLVLNIEYQGRPLALRMVQAKVTAQAAPAPAATVPAARGATADAAAADEPEYARQARLMMERGPELEAAAEQSRQLARKLRDAYAARAGTGQ